MMNIGNRISIIGSPGSGKSTLAKVLSQLLRIPVIRISDIIDAYAAMDTEISWSNYLAHVLSVEQTWIADGYGQDTIDYRLQASDTIIFLDLSLKKCMFNACKRGFLNLFTDNTSAHMAYKKNLHSRLSYVLSPRMYLRVIRFHTMRKPTLIAKIQNSPVENKITFYNKREIDDFLLKLGYTRRNYNE